MQIWDLADPCGKGCLDKQAFFISLKLVALAQNGKEVNLNNLCLSMPVPDLVRGTYIVFLFITLQVMSYDWWCDITVISVDNSTCNVSLCLIGCQCKLGLVRTKLWNVALAEVMHVYSLLGLWGLSKVQSVFIVSGNFVKDFILFYYSRCVVFP